MQQAVLPASLSPAPCKDLVRLGRKRDGGYLAAERDVASSEILMSFGLYDDWSFEQSFQNLRDVPVHGYDGSISQRLFLYLTLKALFGFTGKKSARHWLSAGWGFRKFFSGRNVHKQVHVSPVGPNNVTFEKAIANAASDKIFLKLDIEGGEYRILNSIVDNQALLTGLIIEFHDVDLHIEKIEKFTESLNMTLVHIHANNAGGITPDTAVPLVIEATYSSSAKSLGGDVALPRELDFPNDPGLEEIALIFRQM